MRDPGLTTVLLIPVLGTLLGSAGYMLTSRALDGQAAAIDGDPLARAIGHRAPELPPADLDEAWKMDACRRAKGQGRICSALLNKEEARLCRCGVRCHQSDRIERRHQWIDLRSTRRLLRDDDGVALGLYAGVGHCPGH
jgi:hypothetical protein